MDFLQNVTSLRIFQNDIISAYTSLHNSLLVLNSAHNSFCTVKLKNPAENNKKDVLYFSKRYQTVTLELFTVFTTLLFHNCQFTAQRAVLLCNVPHHAQLNKSSANLQSARAAFFIQDLVYRIQSNI